MVRINLDDQTIQKGIEDFAIIEIIFFTAILVIIPIPGIVAVFIAGAISALVLVSLTLDATSWRVWRNKKMDDAST